ncbi:hypothetical protein EMPS_07494 [Entomortierella parvispora]|uniref:Uncharacterized protein n=1 Tax=Entomortierella parvispora TaxID=205924 RepID=A0A9P3HEJ6_9FUNG|nr:hypothetical protein EMPS_07494 [Entomortierella parvispora]
MMIVWEKVMQRIDYVLIAMFGICFILDIVRAAKLGAAAIFLFAVFWADIWGLGLYSVIALNRFRLSRTFLIIARLKAFAVALIAPSLELHDTQQAIKAYHDYSASSFLKSPKATMQDLLEIVKMIHADPTVVCWGPFESIMETVISKVDDKAVKDGTIHKYCGELQARTILIVITGVVVLIEMLVFWRLCLAESAWARKHLRLGDKNSSATQQEREHNDKDEYQDIEMGENSSRARL